MPPRQGHHRNNSLTRKRVVAVYLSEEVINAVDMMAQSQKLTRSAIIERACAKAHLVRLCAPLGNVDPDEPTGRRANAKISITVKPSGRAPRTLEAFINHRNYADAIRELVKTISVEI